MPILTYVGDHTFTPGDRNSYVRVNAGALVTLTIPANADAAIPIQSVIAVEQSGAGGVNFNPAAGVTLLSRGDVFNTAGQYAVAQLKKVAINTWVLFGDVA
jgi:hypothetical protein